ncbi:glycosyltransferase family 39 protein [Reyranella sp.]|jgi:hypothetical protein|uniref:glycosyltransferase family 39 protein n=1 Tax=Reyranella sp. TaxID=1929291 RepID=UPI002F929075
MSPRDHDAQPSSWAEAVTVGSIAFVLLLGLMAWLDNVHLSTTNGLWKSVNVGDWKADFATAALDPSNYLYYPLMAALCRLLDLLDVHGGRIWQQLAVINVAFGALSVAIVYGLVRRLTNRQAVATLAALVHLGSAGFLSLAVSNEDIVPSYMVILAAMAMASIWFAAPTPRQVAAVAVVFTVGWLMEWRLMFPLLPPLLLALVLSKGTPRRRTALVALFLAVMVAVALLAANRWEGHNGAVGLPDLLWTGKAVGSGWGGFSIDKLGLVIAGMGEYLLGGRNLPAAHLFRAEGAEWAIAFGIEFMLLLSMLLLLWKRRDDGTMRTVAVLFLGTLAAGEVMNGYSQPTDPQMQINVMPWVTIAAALLLAEAAKLTASRHVVILIGTGMALALLAYNVAAFSAERGRDGKIEAALRGLERLSDPARTVYVYSGWETMVTWQYVAWAHRWEGVCDLGPAPRPAPKFKWISLFGPLVHHPSWTNREYVAAIEAELDCAFDKGYRVIAGPVWAKSADQLADWMTSLNARNRGPALRALLDRYRATPLGGPTIDGIEGYREIVRSE